MTIGRPPRRVRSVGSNARPALLATGAGALLVLVVALLACFGWLDLLRNLGAFGLGPQLPDALPLRRLAAASAQPAARVVVAFGSVGLVAGLTLARLPRPGRAGLLAIGSLALLALASEAAYGVQESQSLGTTISNRSPGSGVPIEAVVFAAAGAIPAARRRDRLTRPAPGPAA